MVPTTCFQKVRSVRYEARGGPLLGHYWLRPAASNIAAIGLVPGSSPCPDPFSEGQEGDTKSPRDTVR